MSRRNPALHTSHLRGVHRKYFLIKFLLIIFVIGVLVGGCAYIFRLEKLNIVGIRVEGVSAVDAKEVQDIADSAISDSYIYIVPKRSILFYPGVVIERDVLARFPRIRSVETSLDRRTLVVRVEERKPDVLWCGDDEKIKSLCFYVDDNGLAYAEAPAFSGSVFVHYFTQVSTSTLPFEILPREQYGALRSFGTGLEGIISKPVSVYVDVNKDVFFELSNGLEVRVVLSADMSKIFSNVEAVLRDVNLKKLLTASPTTLQYLDIRFGNKVFYR